MGGVIDVVFGKFVCLWCGIELFGYWIVLFCVCNDSRKLLVIGKCRCKLHLTGVINKSLHCKKTEQQRQSRPQLYTAYDEPREAFNFA